MIVLNIWIILGMVVLLLVLMILYIYARSEDTKQRTEWMQKDGLLEEMRAFALAQEDHEAAEWWIMFCEYIENYHNTNN